MMTSIEILANTFFAFFYILGEHFIGIWAMAIFSALFFALYYFMVKR